MCRAPFTCGHMGHAFWTCPLKVAGVGMGSPRLARIIGFLGCTQWILIYTQWILIYTQWILIYTKSFQVFPVWILYCTKNAEMSKSNLNICK